MQLVELNEWGDGLVEELDNRIKIMSPGANRLLDNATADLQRWIVRLEQDADGVKVTD